MEPKRTFMKKAKIKLFSICFAGLCKQNELKNYFTANHSKTSKCAHQVETGGGGGGHVHRPCVYDTERTYSACNRLLHFFRQMAEGSY